MFCGRNINCQNTENSHHTYQISISNNSSLLFLVWPEILINNPGLNPNHQPSTISAPPITLGHIHGQFGQFIVWLLLCSARGRMRGEGCLPMAIAPKFATHQSSIWHWHCEGGGEWRGKTTIPSSDPSTTWQKCLAINDICYALLDFIRASISQLWIYHSPQLLIHHIPSFV